LLLAILATTRTFGAEIPSHLDASPVDPAQAAALLEQAGLSQDEAVARAESLDQTELAQLSRSDLDQQGGEPIVTIAIILAVLALAYMYFRHQEAMSGQ
jgi:hypothetical protein